MKTKSGKKRKVEDWIPKPYTAIDFLKVTRQLFGLSLVEAKTLYDFLRQMTKDKQEDWI